MKNGRMRAGRILLAAFVGIVAVLWRQPYSVVSPFRSYTEPARAFLRAALAQDSLELRRRAVSPEPVQWALEAARGDAKALTVWASLLRPYSGRRIGDTAIVVFQTNTPLCHLRPVAMTFVNGTGGPRVLLASSSCFTNGR